MENTRRLFLKQSATLVAGTIVTAYAGNRIFAAEKNNHVSPFYSPAIEKPPIEKFTLPELPYDYDALEPHIDKETMEIHHAKHHQKYVDDLNKALSGVSKKLPAQPTFESMFKNMEKLSDTLRNNAGGHYNHSLFWTLMIPGGAGQPTRELGKNIISSFGSFDAFKNQFTQTATKHFGSGWVWLVVTSDGKLVITSTQNQDNPLMNHSLVKTQGNPILALDVWEHAYYLKHRNRRDEYIASWWNVVNWNRVNELYTPAK